MYSALALSWTHGSLKFSLNQSGLTVMVLLVPWTEPALNVIETVLAAVWRPTVALVSASAGSANVPPSPFTLIPLVAVTVEYGTPIVVVLPNRSFGVTVTLNVSPTVTELGATTANERRCPARR